MSFVSRAASAHSITKEWWGMTIEVLHMPEDRSFPHELDSPKGEKESSKFDFTPEGYHLGGQWPTSMYWQP